MASFVELYSKREHVLEAVVIANRNAEEWREQGYRAAVKIQSWFRGCRVRAYIRYLNECATIIQTVFRGHYARILYRRKLRDHLEMLRQTYYDNMATIIQKMWRGYYVRRYVHNYYAQKAYLDALVTKNKMIRDQLEKYKEDVVTSQLARDDALHQLREIEEARRYHYMLSTEIKAGVFQHPERGPLPFEQKMKGIKFAQEMKRHRRCRSERLETATGTVEETPHIDLSASTGDCRLRRTTLPPLTQKKVQGPFPSPEKVWKQRLRPLNPTLRVTTSFNSVDTARAELKAKEQAKIVVDKQFLPFSKGSYSPLIPTQLPYQRSAYGTKHFREEVKACQISQQYFRTIVPSIPIFDNLNS